MEASEINSLYEQAARHVVKHDCSAHPYKYGERLVEIIKEYQPKQILEIGTGMGFTALIMANSAPTASIITIEKDPEHVKVAQELFANHSISDRVNIKQVAAEQYLPTLEQQFDLIFFDGYGIHYEFLPQYYRLLRKDGLAVIANNHLTSKTSDKFFAELHDGKKWRILNQFGDTTVAEKII